MLDILVAAVSLWQIRGVLRNAIAKPGEHIMWMYLRLSNNNLLSPVAGLVFCVYKLWTKGRLGHDLAVTVLFVLRMYSFLYSTVKYVQRVLAKVAQGLSGLVGAQSERRYGVALFAARYFCWPSVMGGVSSP